ncbi:MAG: UbiA family prenyltransferase [Candidatus Binatia bacterium]
MTPAVALRLGRVSNIPTVWTNTLAGALLAGTGASGLGAGAETMPALVLCMLAMSAFYVGGMYLNDAFDRDIDAVERPERPIPSGAIRPGTVFVIGFGLLALGLGLLAASADLAASSRAGSALSSGLLLCAAIVYYNSHHKGDRMAPMVMALCRALIYVTSALTLTGTASEAVYGAAAACFCYTSGLTYVASRENLRDIGNLWPLAVLALPVLYGIPWASTGPASAATLAALAGWMIYSLTFAIRSEGRFVPGAVVRLIAGMSLLDAMLLTGNGFTEAAIAAACMLPLTRLLQRFVPGT